MAKKNLNFRADSVLGNLPEERQEQIAGWIRDCKEGDRYEAARAQLAADGVKVGRTAVVDWFRGWRLRLRIASADSFAAKAVEALKALNVGLTQDQLDAAGQLIFTDSALAGENAEEFREMEYLRLAKQTARTKASHETQKIALRKQAEERAERKLQFEVNKYLDLAAGKLLDKALRSKADEINASDMSQADKIAAMRKAAFSDVDALQASGKVQIPKT